MSKTQTAEKAMATIEGQYVALSEDGTKKITKSYKLVVPIPEERQSEALSFAKNHLLPSLLLKKDPAYKSLRTHNLVSMSYPKASTSKNKKVSQMTPEELSKEIERYDLEIDLALYPEINDLRDAVELAKSEPESFKNMQEARKLKMGDELENKRLANELLGGLDDATGTEATTAIAL